MPSSSSSTASALALTDVHKRFGAVVALNGASITLRPGEVHGLIGGNGSGKSTFAKILMGALQADRVVVRVGDADPDHDTAALAKRLGIAGTYQEGALLDDLTVAENLFVSRGGGTSRFRWFGLRTMPRATRKAVEEVLDRLLLPISVLDRKVRELPLDQRTLAELARVLMSDPKIVIMDELTASLRAEQVSQIDTLLKDLSSHGVTTLFVSHRLEEVKEFCSSCTVFRNGATVLDAEVLSDHSVGEYVAAMTASSGTETMRKRHRRSVADQRVMLGVERIVVPGWTSEVSIECRRGEIVGLGGLAGNGQSELLRAIFRASPAKFGAMTLDSASLSCRTVRDTVRHDIGFISGDREREMSFAQRSVGENLAVIAYARRLAPPSRDLLEVMHLVGKPGDPMRSLSGGNQQKVIVGRWLAMEPRVLLADDPTRGVDVATRTSIHQLLRDLTERGSTVILTSSDDRELAEVCDRVYVLYRGNVVAELTGGDLTEERIGQVSLDPAYQVRVR